MIQILISQEALADLNDGYSFYDAQEAGLGDYFKSKLESDINGLKITGGIHRQVYQDYHRLLSRVFPYAIYYTMSEDVVTIWAVVNCRRHPEWIRKHLAKQS